MVALTLGSVLAVRLQRAWRRRPLLPEGRAGFGSFPHPEVGAGPVAVPPSLVVVSPASSIGGPAWQNPLKCLHGKSAWYMEAG